MKNRRRDDRVNLDNTAFDERIRQWRESEYYPSEIALGMKIPIEFVYHRLNQLGLPLHLHRALQDPEILREAVTDKKLSLADVAKQFGVGYNTVGYYAKKWGVRRRPCPPPLDDGLLRQKYCVELWSTAEIEQSYGVTYSQQRVVRRLKKLGLLKSNGEHRADRREKKKGYRHLTSAGYPLMKIPKGHMTRGVKLDGTFGFSHVIEMEKKLGRPLLKSERVHHIDCDKMNFNIENLLLCGNDPVHQRLHSTLERVVGQLYKAGVVGFEPEKGYYIKKKPKEEDLVEVPEPEPSQIVSETQDCAE
jgi:transposase